MRLVAHGLPVVRPKGIGLLSQSGRKVKNSKQAIAIGLSEARRKGATVPPKKSSRAGSSKKIQQFADSFLFVEIAD
jgi:hypothetical protein